jgi:RND superfamily putative drug exporter
VTPQDRKAGKLPHSNLAARAGRWSAQHRKTAVLGWLAFVAIAFVIGGMVGTKTLAQEDMGNGSSQVADRARADAFPKEASEQVLVQAKGDATASDPAFKAGVKDVVAQLGAAKNVTEIESPLA